MADIAVVVVPWHNAEQVAEFCRQWLVQAGDPRIVFQQDRYGEGCGATKNKGVLAAIERGAEVVIVVDDDCFPGEHSRTMDTFIRRHVEVLSMPARVPLFEPVTDPPSRGTPYEHLCAELMPAASMGFWEGIGDYDAVGQLVHGADSPMRFRTAARFGRYFPLCGMNLAFRPKDWLPWCRFIDVKRFDDIWMGWLWQREAYRRRYCFRLDGPRVRHSRQSNVWSNLCEEARHLERSDTLWRDIATSPNDDYDSLRKLLPV
jgi:hypothetical protein